MTDIKDKCEELASGCDECADALKNMFYPNNTPERCIKDISENRKIAAILRAVPDLVGALEHCTCLFVSVEDGNKVGREALTKIRAAIGGTEEQEQPPATPAPRKVSVDAVTLKIMELAFRYAVKTPYTAEMLNDERFIEQWNAVAEEAIRACGCKPEEEE